MKLEMNNLETRLADASDEERSWLEAYLTFGTVKIRKGAAPVKMSIVEFNPFSRSFASGYVPLVHVDALAEKFSVTIDDQRKPPCQVDTTADLSWLRDYQLTAVEDVCDATRGIVWLPTGAGKTEVGVGLATALPCRWLFLAHRGNLADQAADRYEKRTHLTASRIGEGCWNVRRDDMFVAATFQTLWRAMGGTDTTAVGRAYAFLQSIEGVIVDESHVLPADSFLSVVKALPNAYYRVGLSATPLARGDRKSVYAIGQLGPVLTRVRPQKLIDRGELSKPTIRMRVVEQQSDRPTWDGVEGELIVRSTSRNRAIVEMCKAAAKPGFVFVKELSHGHALVKRLMRAGVRAEFISGEHSKEWRKSHVKRLVQGHFDMLVCSVVFQEGIDIPELRSVVVATGGKSIIATLQRMGRGMRIERDASGAVVKDTFEVWDVADRGNPMTARHARARAAAYEGEGFQVLEVVDN